MSRLPVRALKRNQREENKMSEAERPVQKFLRRWPTMKIRLTAVAARRAEGRRVVNSLTPQSLYERAMR